jgi:hypothetical protein
MPVHWSSRQVLSAIARFHQLPFAQTTLGHASRPVELWPPRFLLVGWFKN